MTYARRCPFKRIKFYCQPIILEFFGQIVIRNSILVSSIYFGS